MTSRSALFLDVDGTLLDIALTPEAVAVPAGLIETLCRLNTALEGAVALVSGRRAADLRRFFPGAGVVLVAEHGSAASVPLLTPARRGRGVPRALTAALRHFAAGHPGALLEVKRHGTALHVRRAPGASVAARGLIRALAEAHRGHVRLIEGKSVFEFIPAGISKGQAIEALLGRKPFRGRVCYVIGDDVTDEDGFAVANRLGGISLRVDGRKAGPAPSIARFTIATPADLRAWLQASAETLLEEAPANRTRKREARP